MNAKRLGILTAAGACLLALGSGSIAVARAAGPKFYFRLGAVKAGPEVDPTLKAYAGEAGVEAEVSDKGMEPETEALAKDAVKDAIKQAVDQAVLKLSLGQSGPLN